MNDAAAIILALIMGAVIIIYIYYKFKESSKGGIHVLLVWAVRTLSWFIWNK